MGLKGTFKWDETEQKTWEELEEKNGRVPFACISKSNQLIINIMKSIEQTIGISMYERLLFVITTQFIAATTYAPPRYCLATEACYLTH